MRRNRKARGVKPRERGHRPNSPAPDPGDATKPEASPRVWSRRQGSTNDVLNSGCDPGLTPWALLSRPVGAFQKPSEADVCYATAFASLQAPQPWLSLPT